jgi:hypothetical protein
MKNNDPEPPAPRRFSLFPKPLSQMLTQVVKPVYKKHGFAEHRILTEWPTIVGEDCAGYSLPQKLVLPRGKKEGGTLHVQVASGRALELQHLQPVILSRIATYFGCPAVSRMVFTQTSSTLFRKGLKAAPPLKPATDGPFGSLAEGCEDADVRRALQSLGESLATVEK